jgi:hypothetical protein
LPIPLTTDWSHGLDEALLVLDGIADEGIRTEAGENLLHLCGGLDGAGGRPPEVGACLLRQQTSANLADDGRRPGGIVVGETARLFRHPHVHPGLAGRADRGEGVLPRIVVDRIRPSLVRLPHAAVRGSNRRIDEDVAGEVPCAVQTEVDA